MTIDTECPKCRGEGWIVVYRATPLLSGRFEEDCPRCNGSGVILVDCLTGEPVED